MKSRRANQSVILLVSCKYYSFQNPYVILLYQFGIAEPEFFRILYLCISAEGMADAKNVEQEPKNVHFKKTVARSSFLSKLR